MNNKFTIGSFGIILNEDKEVLLCHRTDIDCWNLPGGGVETGETPWDACIREVEEETGLLVEITTLTGTYSKPHQDEVVFSFLCEVNGGSIRINQEADKIEYFSFENLPKNISPKHKDRIKDFFLDQEKVYFKAQSGPSSKDLFQ